jgi:hypothetical protein
VSKEHLHMLALFFIIAAACLVQTSWDKHEYHLILIQLLIIIVNLYMFFNMSW